MMKHLLCIVMTSLAWVLGQCSDNGVRLTCPELPEGTKKLTVTVSYHGVSSHCMIQSAFLNNKTIVIPENNTYILDVTNPPLPEYEFVVQTDCGTADCKIVLPPQGTFYVTYSDVAAKFDDGDGVVAGHRDGAVAGDRGGDGDDKKDTQHLSRPVLAILGTCMSVMIFGMLLKFKKLQMCAGKLKPRIWSSDTDVESNSSGPEGSVGYFRQDRDPEAQTHLTTPLTVNSS